MKHSLASKGITWSDLQEPSVDELAGFVREQGLDPLDAEFIVQDHHRPEVTVREQYLVILVEVPVFDKQARVTQGVPLYVIVRENSVATLHYEPLIALEMIRKDFGENPEKQAEYFGNSSLSLALFIIGRIYQGAFQKLNRLTKHVEIAADAIFRGNERKMVEEVAVLTRDVMDFRRVIRVQQHLFEEVPNHAWIDESAALQWERLERQLAKLWDMLDGLTESMNVLGRTNDMLLQHKENQLLRLLSFYSIITIPVLVLASPFNTEAANYRNLFWVVFSLLVFSLALTFFWAKRKKIL